MSGCRRGSTLVIETVGAATWEHSVRSCANGGTIVVAGTTTGDASPAQLTHVFYRQLSVVGSTMGTRDELIALVAFLDATGARPVIDAVLPLADAATAFARMVAGDVVGKLVLTV